MYELYLHSEWNFSLHNLIIYQEYILVDYLIGLYLILTLTLFLNILQQNILNLQLTRITFNKDVLHYSYNHNK